MVGNGSSQGLCFGIKSEAALNGGVQAPTGRCIALTIRLSGSVAEDKIFGTRFQELFWAQNLGHFPTFTLA